MIFEQFRHGVAARRQQLKAVVVHRHGDRSPLDAGEPSRPEKANALMHKAAFKGIGKQVAPLSGAAGFHQQLIGLRQHREILLPRKQRLQRLQFWGVEFAAAGLGHLMAQVVRE